MAKIILNDIYNLYERKSTKGIEELRNKIKESDSYKDVVQSILKDFVPIIETYLDDAIDCGFDEEILEFDYEVPKEVIDILKKYSEKEIEYESCKTQKKSIVQERRLTPYERTKNAVYATGNKWAIENFHATHD